MDDKKILESEVEEAINFFIHMGFIEDLNLDEKFYVKKLIEYAKQNLKGGK
jgi:hypothetical protein